MDGVFSLSLQPLLRDAYGKNPTMTKDEAKSLLDRCMKVLFYRDCRTLNKVMAICLGGRTEGVALSVSLPVVMVIAVCV